MENIKECLIEFINNPYNDIINFNLAVAYENEKQYAASFSYYLKCAEFTNNNILASECLIHCALCINAQGGRDAKELYLIKHAITISPNSLEPYYIASLYFSWRSSHLPEQRFWLDSYMYANIAINLIENNSQSKEKFKIPIDFEIYELYYQKAYAGMNIGKINEAREIFIKILQNYELSDSTKNFIIFKLDELPEPNHPIISYSKNNINKLKFLFSNSNKIDNNFSQIYQDMYVLSMHNGKMNGTYLEIGAGDYKYGNNTYLLESEFNWTGVSIDFNQNLVNNFNKNRNNNCICSNATTIDYLDLLKNNYETKNIDYLQLDCDPPNITFDILTKIPFDKYKFGVITYEHDFYNDITGSYREKSREFLKEKGYKLIAGNISPYGDKCPFEDWWIHPELIDENIWKLFERTDDEPINGEKYMLTKEIINNHMISINTCVKPKIISEDLILSNTILDNFLLKNKDVFNLNDLHAQWYENLSGINEYRFYSYLSTLFNNIVILDIGTGFGISAVALSHNENNHVISYNLINQIRDNSKIYTKKNITFKIKNVLEDLTEDFIKNIKIIMIDIDHFGEEEIKIIDRLEQLNYSGIVILDDIHHPWEKEGKCMKELWESINYTKYDITKYGHNTGTGIFFMNFNINIIEETSLEENNKTYSPKIIDCFIFYNELDLLNYRLNLLDENVDYFVIVEATHTHSGKEKKLFYNENRDLFEKFKYKIIHIIVDDFPYKYPDIDIEKNQQWKNENYQRNCIKRGIDRLTLDDSDIITICDLDEIPNPKILNELKDNKRQITNSCLKMDMYYYNLNNKTNINDWIAPKLISYKEFKKIDITIQEFRYKKIDNIIENGGWHLSFFGDKDFIINKIQSYGHQEFNNDKFLSNIEDKINLNKDLFNRKNFNIQYININDNNNLPPKYNIYLQKYINYNSIFNEDWYPDNQINDMCNLFNKVKELSGNIIEIGCWEGKSTSFLANKCYPEILICNDTWEGNIEESKISGNIHITEVICKQRDVYKIFINNMNLLTNSNYKIVRKDCLKWLQEYKEPIKFIHIDASHDYDSVYKTINLILPNLIKGGIICGDDFYNASIKNYPLNGGVEKAVKDALPNYKNIGNLWYFINNSTLLQKTEEKQETKFEYNIKDIYDFVPCHDQIGNDLYRVDVSNIENTLKTVASSWQIKAVNTQGYVKDKVERVQQINNWWYPNDGIYIKKPVNDYLKQVSQKSIPVFGTLVCTTSKWLIKQLESIDYPIENFIIINNNSKVLAKELDIIVKKEYKFIKNLKVYHMPYNLGCAEGWNMIIKSFMFSPYWIISNDDVSFGPGVLKNMNLAAQNSEVGLVHKNPALLPKMEKFGTFELFLIKDWVIQKYGLFDINFYPAYFEDYDYIMRLINKPIKIINSVDGIIYHGDTSNYNISGANTIKSNDKVKTRLLIAKYKNLEYFKKKWNCYPEYLSDNSRPNEYPFGNNNNLNNTYFDINFCREKHLLNTLDILDTPETSNTLNSTNLYVNNNISLNIKEKLFVKQNLIVIDNFYDDPDKIREYALSLNYQSPENHGAVGYRCEYGRKIEDGTKQLFEKLLHTTIPNGNNHGEWNYSTNGCFQWCNAAVPIVYHCDSQQYAAIIYLTPDAPPNCGTSFFRHKKYKIRNSEIFSKSDWYQSDLKYKEPHLDKTQWEAVDNIGNVYNRLVIFDAQYIHAVTEYFGENINNSRLFQLFFFNIN